jgi:hypothetical protein
MESRQIRWESVVQCSAAHTYLFMVPGLHIVAGVSCWRKLPHGLLSSSRCSPGYALGEVLPPYRLGQVMDVCVECRIWPSGMFMCYVRMCRGCRFSELFVHEPCRLYLAIGLLVAVFAGSFQSRVLVHV